MYERKRVRGCSGNDRVLSTPVSRGIWTAGVFSCVCACLSTWDFFPCLQTFHRNRESVRESPLHPKAPDDDAAANAGGHEIPVRIPQPVSRFG